MAPPPAIQTGGLAMPPPSSSSSSTSLATSSSRPTSRASSSRATSPVTALEEQPPAKPRSDKAKLTEQWGPPPDVIKRGKHWLYRGRLLGEGGFARVYLCTEQDNKTAKALKVIAKEQLKSTKNKSKLFGEIKIHQAMQHPNIISFEHCFEDEGCVYMQLELCANGSMLDLLRRRKRYTEPEARFYLVQLVGACDYMHSNSVIHRDLKLGNLMLDQDMNLRVGDFGLAALVKFPGERKKTICGTPNYIAPEILFDTTNGHSFEVDIWSIGVILYTLLVGKPPFQTKEVKNIYKNIKALNYEFPPDVTLSPEATDLIASILTQQPDERPSLQAILNHEWFTTGPFPPSIPNQAMNTAPDWRKMSNRTSLRNFENAKVEAGIVVVDNVMGSAATTTAPSPALSSMTTSERIRATMPITSSSSSRARRQSEPLADVAEEETETSTTTTDQRVQHQVPIVAANKVTSPPRVRMVSTREARTLEQEVERVLAPESPISDLIKSARKPLMVSPRTRATTSSSASTVPTIDLFSGSSTADKPMTTTTKSDSRPIRTTSLNARSSLSTSTMVTTKENEPVGARKHAPMSTSRHQRTGACNALSPSKKVNGQSQSQQDVDDKEHSQAVPVKHKTIVEPISTRYPARELYETTWHCLDKALTLQTKQDLEALPVVEDAIGPKVFITSWVDYTHKYGTAYSLTDGTAGLYFNDSTTMILSPDKVHFDYISNRKGNVYSRRHYTTTTHPEELSRKAYLLTYFEDYMATTLTRDVSWTFVDENRTKNMDFLVKYYRMKNAIVFKLSNEVLQFNFYDHTKILLTERGQVITFISPSFKLETNSIGSLFREARSLGFYSRSSGVIVNERLDEIKLIVTKLEYCRDVLKTLSLRKTQQQQQQQ
ncbi:Cell cycle serine/threonine-protein kinase cdc5/MSD2 [Microbotryomycetes sp. JL221]|nr:Cell cycle serine/threonine-protein kinase cdc5/MSD2 [Microbotryomycetes sp. JL221]